MWESQAFCPKDRRATTELRWVKFPPCKPNPETVRRTAGRSDTWEVTDFPSMDPAVKANDEQGIDSIFTHCFHVPLR